MNSKQKICAIAAGVMAVSSVMPAGVLGADYSKELQEAYKWAYENGVTTMNTIDQANMYGNLTRIAMAKMLANYAINNLGKKPDTSIDCTFPDVTSAMDKAYDNGVTNACQLGIMGQGITNFDPNGTVTRAQFGTALSRLLWGDKNNASDEEQRAGVQYYKYHLNALNKSYNGTTIMKDISNPSQNEVRGYVMLMLQRSAGMVGKSTEECTATQQLLCLLEGNCTSACEEAMKDISNGSDEEDNKKDTVDENEVKSGKLTVGVEDYSSNVRSIPNEGMVIVNSINFKGSEEITLHSVTFETSELTSNSDVKAIWFEKDGSRVGARATVDSEGVATVNFNGDGVTVKSSESYDLVMELDWDAPAGAEISFKITDVDSSAVAGGVKISQANTTTMRTTSYKVAGTTFEAQTTNSGTTYKLGERDTYELGRFKIANKANARDEKTLVVKTITLKNNGTADVDALSDIEILRDSKVVSSKATTDGKYITVTLNDEITAGKTATYTLQGKINAVNGTDGSEYYQFVLNKNTDIVVDEIKNGFRSTVIFEKDWNNNKDTLAKFNVIGGKFTFKTTSNSSSVNAGEGYSDVLVSEGELIATANALIEEANWETSLTIRGSGFDALKNIKIEIGGKTYTADIRGNEKARTNGDITLKKGTQTVKVYANLRNNILWDNEKNTGDNVMVTYHEGKLVESHTGYKFKEWTTITIKNITADNFSNQGEYSDSSEKFEAKKQIAGSIAVSNINIKSAKFTITKTSTDSNIKMVATSSKTVSIYAGTMKNTQQFPINVNTITLSGALVEGSDAFQEKENLSLDFVINGKVLDTVRFDKDNMVVNFNSLGINLPVDSNVEFEIQATPTTITWGHAYQFHISAEGNDDNGNSVKITPKTAVKVTIVNKGSANSTSPITDVVKATTLFTKGTTRNAIAEFEVVVKDEDLTLKEVIFSGDGFTGINDIELSYKYDGKEYSINGDYDSDKKIIDNISTVFVPGTYKILAYANFEDSTWTISLSGIDYKFEWVDIIEGSATGINYTHSVVNVVPVVSIQSTNGDLTDLMTLRVSNTSNDEDFMLENIVLNQNTGLDIRVQIDSTTYSWTVTGDVVIFDLSKKVSSKSHVDLVLVSNAPKVEAGAYSIKVNSIKFDGKDLDNSNSDLGTNKFQKTVTVKTN